MFKLMPKFKDQKGIAPTVVIILVALLIAGVFLFQSQFKNQTVTTSTSNPQPSSPDQITLKNTSSASETTTIKPTVVSSPSPKTTVQPSPTNQTSNKNTTQTSNTTTNSNTTTLNSSSTPTPTPAPTPTPTPQRITADSCSGVSVEGATFVKTYSGQNGTYYQYSINSGATAKLTAQVTPAGGYVNWKLASVSSNLPNGGSFSYHDSNNTSVVNWTAPSNSSGSEQGIDVRGDISESPNTWKYCPTLTFAVKPQ